MTPVTITGNTVLIIILSVIAIVGFILAYTEYSSKEKIVKNYEEDFVQSEELIKSKMREIEDVYKSVIEDQNASLELYESYIKNFDAAITLTDKKLKELDNKGVFSSDDEVGFFFQNVIGLQNVLNKFKIDKEILDSELSREQK